MEFDEDVYIVSPLQFNTLLIMETTTSPLNPRELAQMVAGLREINKSYLFAIKMVEESGERTILATGELYLEYIRRIFESFTPGWWNWRYFYNSFHFMNLPLSVLCLFSDKWKLH